MHCACLVSLEKPDQICGRTIVDWFSSSNANLEMPETCMLVSMAVIGWLFYWGGTQTVGRATMVSMINARTLPITKSQNKRVKEDPPPPYFIKAIWNLFTQ